MAESPVDESSTVNNSISSKMWNMKKEKCKKNDSARSLNYVTFLWIFFLCF